MGTEMLNSLGFSFESSSPNHSTGTINDVNFQVISIIFINCLVGFFFFWIFTDNFLFFSR